MQACKLTSTYNLQSLLPYIALLSHPCRVFGSQFRYLFTGDVEKDDANNAMTQDVDSDNRSDNEYRGHEHYTRKYI